MKAIQFNLCFDAYFAAPLIGVGFVRDKNNFVLEDGQTQLVIKRWHGKFSNACQCTNLSLLLRHKFLRNLEKEQVSGYPKLISDYPVKEKISVFRFSRFSWRYRPQNLGIREYDEVEYGRADDIKNILFPLVNKIKKDGLELSRYLKPEVLYRQIKKNGENAYCENIWLEDYEFYLSNCK
ncbi:MAG: hypothetical protein IPH06_03740 [Alphaproteobacteria bacterium]|nr:hypothetical protein [Alphaproteobacteria bacterium]QQS57153.1 MAG: hypothetical protein IPN28_13055 [Alphaproteobacteria bacterium]